MNARAALLQEAPQRDATDSNGSYNHRLAKLQPSDGGYAFDGRQRRLSAACGDEHGETESCDMQIFLLEPAACVCWDRQGDVLRR